MLNKVLINTYYEMAFEYLCVNNLEEAGEYIYTLWLYDESFDKIADTLKLSRNEVGMYLIHHMFKMFK